MSSILEELEESIYRSHSLGLPLDLGKEDSSNLDPTTLVLATGLSTLLGGQRRYDSSIRTLLFDLIDPQTTGSPSGTVRSQRVPEVRNPEDYRTALDMSARTREPSVFYGMPEEDAQDWLKRFEELSEINCWSNKLSYVRVYLEGAARKWYNVTQPNTRDSFKMNFMDTFTEKHFYQVEAKIRSRKQGLHEPVRNCYYDILDSCRQLELEQGEVISESTKLEHLLRGLSPTLLEKVWPLIRNPIKTTEDFFNLRC